MKKVLFIFLLLAGLLNGYGIVCAQSTGTDSLFIVTYTTGPSWDAAKAPNEQAYFKEHSANLSRWRKEGVIRLGARYGEKGIIIISASSLSAAKDLIGKDEGVSNSLFNAEVQKFSVFYYGCVEKPDPKN